MQTDTDQCDLGRVAEMRSWDKAEEGRILFRENQGQELDISGRKHFGNTNVNDNASLWQGNNHGVLVHNHHHYPRQSQSQYDILLKSLTFDRMEARLQNVAAALSKTCQWLFEHEDFRVRGNESQTSGKCNLLWVEGKPGSGKSTIMRETLTWAQINWSSRIILSYFFNALSPHVLEKSSLRLYRSLTYQLQLLCTVPVTRELFERTFALKIKRCKCEKDDKFEEVEDWTEVELQNFWTLLMTTAGFSSVIFFIDALDEGGEDDIRRMLGFFPSLTQRKTTPTGCRVRICFSSRHYPQISIEDSVSLTVEGQIGHDQDIKTYIKNQLIGTNNGQMQVLERRIHERSAGVFLWVVLVIPMLNKAYDEGKSVKSMLERLGEVPARLHDIFTQILSQDHENTGETIRLLEWVLFSLRPLNPFELYSAIQRDRQDLEDVNDYPTDKDSVSRYILCCSRGLVEITGEGSFFVQFVHETVRDYLLHQGLPKHKELGTTMPCGKTLDFRAERCHIIIAERCLDYLLYLHEKHEHARFHTQRDLAEYAASNWWRHWRMSNISSNERILNRAVKLLTEPSLLGQWEENSIFPWSGLQSCGTPLHAAARIGIPELVSRLLLLGSDIDAEAESYGKALYEASTNSHVEVVQLLLEKGANANTVKGSALQTASSRGHDKVVRALLEKGADATVNEGDALRLASTAGHVKVVQILLEHGADVKFQETVGDSALWAALAHGHRKIASMLVQKGADESVLRAATTAGRVDMVEMMLDILHSDIEERPNIEKLRLALLQGDQPGRSRALSKIDKADVVNQLQSLRLPHFERISGKRVRFYLQNGNIPESQRGWQYIQIPVSECG